MNIADVIDTLEILAPLNYAESFDNVGLLIGQPQTKLTGVLVTLDVTQEVVREAIQDNCNMIICFHPIIFLGLKKINGNNYVERIVIDAIKNDIAIYAIHTALDNQFLGVNHYLSDALGLINRKILIPKKRTIKKLTTYVPTSDVQKLRDVLFEAGAGNIGNYSKCSFSHQGIGSFEGNENSHPTVGKINELHLEPETQLGVIYQQHLESKILSTLHCQHPYEEVAYEVTTLENKNQQLGMGMYGELASPMKEQDFLQYIKETLQVTSIRHSKLLGNKISRVAVLGGSGSEYIANAKTIKADIFITSDIKYHQFFQAEEQIIIADIGHYESEWLIKSQLMEYLREKITNIAIILSKINTNPVNYS